MSMPTRRWSAPYHCLAWVLIASLLAASCATRNVPPIGAGGKPFKPESDEVRLWSQAEKEEEALAKKAKIYDDPLLEEYLGKLGDRLLPDEVRAAGGPGFRFGVMSDPTLNAFAMPNGRVYVHSGLLSRLDNEAQLAMILGHEMTHVTSRHALRFTRDATNKQILFTVLAVAASIGVAVAPGSRQQAGDSIRAAGLSQTGDAVLGVGLPLGAVGRHKRYGPRLEREARLDIRAGRFKLAQAQLDRVAVITPKDPTLHLYYGDLYRLQSQRARSVADKDDFAKNALEHYELSAGLDPTFPDPFRQLGFLYYQQKDAERARDAFKKYLALKPDAPDAKRIREYLVELER